MNKVVDARPMLTMYLGVVLVLVATLVLWSKSSDEGLSLFISVKKQHVQQGVEFKLTEYLQRCVSNLACVGAYVGAGWRVASPLERSTTVTLVLGLILTMVGRYWNPALQASNKTQANGMDQNALPAKSAMKPGRFPWA
jgi:hypothetical protein